MGRTRMGMSNFVYDLFVKDGVQSVRCFSIVINALDVCWS